MAFLYNIPQATDVISVSQGNILNNFAILGAIAGNASTGGTPINAVAGFNFVDFASQGSSIPSTSTDNYLYAGVSPTTGKPELYISYQNGQQYPTTASILSRNAAPASQSDGFTFLPSGILIKWGSSTGTAGNFTYTMPTGANIPVFTQVLNVQVCVWELGNLDTNHAIRIINYGPVSINMWGSARTTTATAAVGFSWMAIGY